MSPTVPKTRWKAFQLHSEEGIIEIKMSDVGRTPWSAADALVGFRCTWTAGRGRPPHVRLFKLFRYGCSWKARAKGIWVVSRTAIRKCRLFHLVNNLPLSSARSGPP